MLKDYLTLGLSPGSSNTDIRKKYIQLVKLHPPEHDSEQFQDISTAYERIKDEQARIRTQLFGPLNIRDSEQALFDLIRAARPKRQRVGLKDLLAASSKASQDYVR